MSVDMSVDPTGPNLQLTPEEKRVYLQLFRQADTGGAGIVTGEVAVTFFDKTRLDSRILGEIWQISDNDNRGYLTPVRFGIVLRLIGHAQAGREPTAALALEPGPIPRFDGLSQPTQQVTSPPPPSPLQAQGSGGPVRIPPLTPEKVAQYSALFERQALQNGTLPGDQAKQIFDKSGLPNEILGRIWMLADTEQRGALVQAEFTIAMHLLTCMKTGLLRALPNILPAPLYEAAMRRLPPGSSPRQSPQNTGVSAIPRQMTGAVAQRQGSPLGRPPICPQSVDWAVTAGDKAKFDQIFTDLDKGVKGYITGEEAVPFFSQSNLPEDALAQIWDLADINSQGHLSRDEFAVAMFLIRQQRGNRTGATLPATLPQNLVPPSLRNRPRPSTSAFDPPPATPVPPPQPKSAMDDLFLLDSSSPSPAPGISAQQTGGSNANDPFAGGPSSPTMRPATASVFKPFVPSSSFGRGLAGPADSSSPSHQPSQLGEDDLLGDTDEASKNLSGETAELANLSNQIGSLSKQMQDTQAKRSATQSDLSQSNSQKANFEQRLSQLRTLYEKEAADTRALEEQLRNARNETQKLQGECMKLEGIYRDVQNQHHQLTVALQTDQQENFSLRERIRVVNTEISQLKPQIEKLKLDTRQQKGLVAINKKQLSTTEGERDKLKSEAEDLSRSVDDVSRQANTASPSSPHAKLASPALSTASGNNPFFNRTASTDIMGTFAAPPARNFSENTFDDVFGPSFPVGSRATPPPPAIAFKQQHTGTSVASHNSSIPRAASPNVSRQASLVAEPPAPPESRQITSSFLPFPEPAESLSSSRQVSPPASRAEGLVSDAQNPFPGEAASSVSFSSTFPGEDTDKNDTPIVTPAPTDDGVKAPEGSSHAMSSSDPFANTDQAKAKAEFDNAFAAFTSSSKNHDKSTADMPKSRSAFDTEFPPISSLEREDYSDSDSERGGFEDDFAPTSHQQIENKKSPVIDSPKIEKVSGEEVPSAASKEQVDKNELSSSHATINDPAAHKSTVDDIFGSSASHQPNYQTGQLNITQKGAFDDLDDEFEGLEDAKEGSADDDFANISRSGLDDFNPVFDSSPPPSQAKSESTAFGNESSFDFISATSAAGAPAPASGNQQKGTESHDWDAIFSGLDANAAAPATAASVPALGAAKVEEKGDDATVAAERPTVERMQTEASATDDPLLKELVSMGYGRTAALNALEKYDYNVDKAANYLASHS